MRSRHARHLATELSARVFDREFLKRAGISRRTMQDIFVRDKWEETLYLPSDLRSLQAGAVGSLRGAGGRLDLLYL